MRQRLFSFLMLSAVASAAVTNVSLRGTTPTQAILNYRLSAPTGAACTVEISESSSYAPLVHDVDPSLFPGASADNRTGSIVNGAYRVFVAGTRGAAQQALDGKWYSRALAAYTLHYFRINNNSACDTGGPATGTFVTANLPAGRLYNDPIPTSGGGVTAWPHFYGTSRTPVVDPQTGLKILPVTVPGDQPGTIHSQFSFLAPFDHTGTWNLTLGGLPATFSAGNSAKLFLPANLTIFVGSTYNEVATNYLSWFQTHMTMWCSGACATSASRMLDYCLTVNGVTCASAAFSTVLPTSSPSTALLFGGMNPGMTDWDTVPSVNPAIDHVLASQHVMQVSVSGGGTTVNWADNSKVYFRPQAWTANTPITLAGTGCTASTLTMAAVTSSTLLTLNSTAGSGCTSATATVSPFGLLVWKDSSSTDQITLGAANWDSQTDFESEIDSSAMQDFTNACGGPPITLNGAAGYLCYHTAAVYWESASTASIRYLGSWTVPSNVNGASNPLTALPGQSCSFDPVNTGVVSCGVSGFKDTLLIKVAYTGDYAAVPGGTVPPTCNGSNTRCLTFTNLATSLTSALLAYSPGFAAFCCPANVQVVGGNSDGTVNIQTNAGSQNSLGWLAVYDPSLPGYIAARSSWDWYPATWSGIHSVQLRRGTYDTIGQLLSTIGGSGGPLSGADPNAGAGPYRVRVPAGFPNSVSACPAQPVGSTLPASSWPTGNHCITVAVAGQPADPSPYVANLSGVVATSGSPTISGSGFLQIYAGKPIVISGTTYMVHSVTDSSTMSLSSNFAGSTGTYAATLEGEPPCSLLGAVCDVPTDHWKRNGLPGDVFFVAQPSTHNSGATAAIGYSRFAEVFFVSTSEAMRLLIANGLSWTFERAYGGSSTVQEWDPNTYLYVDSGQYNFTLNDGFSGYDFMWNYRANPTGSANTDIVDVNDPSGHGYLNVNSTAGFYSNLQTCLQTHTLWNGNAISECTLARFGLNLAYINDPGKLSAYNAAFSGQIGVQYAGNSGVVDTHPNYNYFLNPRWFIDGHPLNGDEGITGDSSHPGTNLGGSLYKFTAAQRGCTSTAACVALEKALPVFGFCGKFPMLNVSGPGGAIDGTAAHGYQYRTVVGANEGVAGTNPGDVLANCPGANVAYSYAPQVGTNGADQFDITVGFAGPWNQDNTRNGFWKPALNGELSQDLGHGLNHYRWHNPFMNLRGTPDGAGVISQAVGLDGFKTSMIMTLVPAFNQVDSINGADFVPVKLSLNAPAGMSVDNAIVEFGYAENGNPANGMFCTGRAETCAKGNQAANLYHFETSESGSYSGQSCAISCIITVPAVSGRMLYYDVQFRAGTSVQFTTPIEIIAVP